MIVFLAARALACDCDSPSLVDALAERDAVFAAVIGATTLREDEYVEATVDVLEVWKGDVGATETVVTWRDEAGCGVGLDAGERWLLFVDEEDWDVRLCSRSGSLEAEHAREDVCRLGRGVVPEGVDAEPGDLCLEAGGTPGCGCASGPLSGGVALPALLPLIRRRRR